LEQHDFLESLEQASVDSLEHAFLEQQIDEVEHDVSATANTEKAIIFEILLIIFQILF
tara:strand:+ start:1903 stop:2076 length:174 start_codon:yes stop_codon:yes gene_type:complete